jgi:hypothetical protein
MISSRKLPLRVTTSQLRRSGHEISVHCWSGTAVSDPIRFRQVVRTLLSIATGHGGPTIGFVGELSNDSFLCTVVDGGEGMSPYLDVSRFPLHADDVDLGLPTIPIASLHSSLLPCGALWEMTYLAGASSGARVVTDVGRVGSGMRRRGQAVRRTIVIPTLLVVLVGATAAVAAPPSAQLAQESAVQTLYGDGSIDCPDHWADDTSTPVGTVEYTATDDGIRFRIVLTAAAANWTYAAEIGQQLGDCIDWDRSQYYPEFTTDNTGAAVFEGTYLLEPGTYWVNVNIGGGSVPPPNLKHREIGPDGFVEISVAPPIPVGDHTVGLVDPTQGQWHLRSHAGVTDSFFFGNPGDLPFMGDWNCDGVETPGMYRQSDGYAYLRNSNDQGAADIKFFFGNRGDVPIAGDFNGDGCDTVSIYRPSNQGFYIINELGSSGGGLGTADRHYTFGDPGDKPFVGDFNGDGMETAGLHRESTGLVYFRNIHRWGAADHQFVFGDSGDQVVAGDWNGDGSFTPAVFRPSNTHVYYRYSNTQGNADSWFVFGQPDWLPVAGDSGR